jgi:hypothetical protein
MQLRAAIVAFVIVVGGGCGGPTPQATQPPATPGLTARPTSSPVATPSATPEQPSATSTPTPADARTAGWHTDLELLVPEMDRLHPELDHGVSIDELNAAVADLVAQIPSSTDDELMVGVLRVAAMVSTDGCDAHTGAYVWGSGTYPVHSLPLRLWLFGDDVYVVDALPPYERLIGQRLDSLNGHVMSDVLTALDPFIPRDNDQTLRLLMPRFLLTTEILHGVGLIDNVASVDLWYGTSTRNPQQVTVNAMPMSEYNAWAGPYGLHLPVDPDVPYLSNVDELLWHSGPDSSGTLYVQYNRVDPLGPNSLSDWLSDPAATTLALDIRHNFGGELSALEPVVFAVDTFAAEHPARTYVITGRNTFSAGSMLVGRLTEETDALVVGETMGGCPAPWADPEQLVLPYSGIPVSVSTLHELGAIPNDNRLAIDPDVPTELTVDDWTQGIDPAMGAIDQASE